MRCLRGPAELPPSSFLFLCPGNMTTGRTCGPGNGVELGLEGGESSAGPGGKGSSQGSPSGGMKPQSTRHGRDTRQGGTWGGAPGREGRQAGMDRGGETEDWDVDDPPVTNPPLEHDEGGTPFFTHICSIVIFKANCITLGIGKNILKIREKHRKKWFNPKCWGDLSQNPDDPRACLPALFLKAGPCHVPGLHGPRSSLICQELG